MNETSSIRLSLCCLFNETPIRFRSTTVKYLKKLQNEGEKVRLEHISKILADNVDSLKDAIQFCAVNGIGSFRISSQLFPCYTHKEVGYTLDEMPNQAILRENLKECRRLAKFYDVRLSMHPDQFVVLNSPNETTVANSIEELEYHAIICEHVGGDVINIHGGGVYGDKESALKRLDDNIKKLSPSVLVRLTLENDDKSYSPEDLLPICVANNIPFVYDVHHHRCTTYKLKRNLDEVEIGRITEAAMKTWNREPLMHISSPKYGWERCTKLMSHHSYINYERDFPECWKSLNRKFTIDVEAKAKETAVIRLREQLKQGNIYVWSSLITQNIPDDIKKWKFSFIFDANADAPEVDIVKNLKNAKNNSDSEDEDEIFPQLPLSKSKRTLRRTVKGEEVAKIAEIKFKSTSNKSKKERKVLSKDVVQKSVNASTPESKSSMNLAKEEPNDAELIPKTKVGKRKNVILVDVAEKLLLNETETKSKRVTRHVKK